MDFLIGGLAGAGATFFTNPIDVVKTRMQLEGELGMGRKKSPRYRNMFHAVYVIARTDGPLALQKGLVPAVVMGFSLNSVRLGIYHIAEEKGWTKNKKGKVNLLTASFWSSLSGIISGVTSNPATVIKTRIQAASHPSIAVGKQHGYKGMWHGCTVIYKTEGIKGFFAGVGATCFRLAIGSSVQLTSFSFAKQLLLNHGICEHSPFGLAFWASWISGLAMSVIVCPFDVVSVRLYNQDPNKEPLYNGLVDCIRKIYLTEGMAGLYKGFAAFYLRIAPHTTISLVIWDMCNIYLK